MTSDREPLRNVLKRMPLPPPRRGFADEAIANAIARSPHSQRMERNLFARWETWAGAAMGAVAAVLVTVMLLRPALPTVESGVTLAVDESTTIDVVIDSERTLDDATIRVAATGSIELNGFEDNRQAQWQTRLDRGRNVLSLPIVARSTGNAELVATIEHEGRTRRVAVKMKVRSPRVKVA